MGIGSLANCLHTEDRPLLSASDTFGGHALWSPSNSIFKALSWPLAPSLIMHISGSLKSRAAE